MNAVKKLRSKGYRITSQREMVLQTIGDHPLAVDEIYQKLADKINLTSVYRNLNVLVKNRIVREVDFGDGKKRFELSESKNHHHHLVCNNCGKVEDIKMDEEVLLGKVKSKSDFLVKSHRLEFFGLCKNCN